MLNQEFDKQFEGQDIEDFFSSNRYFETSVCSEIAHHSDDEQSNLLIDDDDDEIKNNFQNESLLDDVENTKSTCILSGNQISISTEQPANPSQPIQIIENKDININNFIRIINILKFTCPVLFQYMLFLLIETITLYFVGQYCDLATYSALGNI